MDPVAAFSPTYAQARTAFLEACAERSLSVTSVENPNGRGPNGEALMLDYAVFGPDDAAKALVVQSATHGVEGYCGSGCQIALLRGSLLDTLPPDLKIVFIHALNPHGFAWDRRVNEDNVDLNRNFVDHDAPYPDNEGYRNLAAAIAPEDYGDASIRAANAVLKDYAIEHGAMALQEAITRGQYTWPQGLYFGGNAPVWSNRTFRSLIAETCTGTELAVLVDIHTGLGPFGVGELIVEFPSGHPITVTAKSWWGERVKSALSGESVSPALAGTVDIGFVDAAPAPLAIPVTLEFGTYSPVEVYQATRADNWLHNHGDLNDPAAAAIKAEIRRVFYPDTDDWKRMVAACTEEIVIQALEGMRAA